MISRVRKLELTLRLLKDEPGANIDMIDAALTEQQLTARQRLEESAADLQEVLADLRSLVP